MRESRFHAAAAPRQRAKHEGDQRGGDHQAERPWQGRPDQVANLGGILRDRAAEIERDHVAK